MPRKKTPVTTPAPATRSSSRNSKKVVEEEEIKEVKKPKLTDSSSSLKKSGNTTTKVAKLSPEETLFEKYCDAASENIDPFGIEKLFNDLEVSPESFEALCFCYKLNAEKMGYFTKDEFINGLKKIKCNTTPQLQKYLKNARKEFDDPSNFKSIYEFSFGFCKGDNKDTRTIDMDSGKEMLKCVLGAKYTITSKFVEFLPRSNYKSFNMDQWKMFYEFAKKVKPDLSDYSENDCWPVMIDDFVEWSRKKPSIAPPNTDAN